MVQCMLIGKRERAMNKYIKNLMKNLNPSEWFDNPLDRMPIATDHTTPKPEWVGIGTNRYAPPERRAELEENPRPEEEVAEWFMEKPDESDEIEQEKTMHQKMYEIATAKYNPFSVGGSENLGGSENAQKL